MQNLLFKRIVFFFFIVGIHFYNAFSNNNFVKKDQKIKVKENKITHKGHENSFLKNMQKQKTNLFFGTVIIILLVLNIYQYQKRNRVINQNNIQDTTNNEEIKNNNYSKKSPTKKISLNTSGTKQFTFNNNGPSNAGQPLQSNVNDFLKQKTLFLNLSENESSSLADIWKFKDKHFINLYYLSYEQLKENYILDKKKTPQYVLECQESKTYISSYNEGYKYFKNFNQNEIESLSLVLLGKENLKNYYICFDGKIKNTKNINNLCYDNFLMCKLLKIDKEDNQVLMTKEKDEKKAKEILENLKIFLKEELKKKKSII